MLSLRIAPHPDLKKKALKVDPKDPENLVLIQDLIEKMQLYSLVGLNALMFGISKSILILKNPELIHDDILTAVGNLPMAMMNAEITSFSDEMQTFEEASPCFPGISAPIKRPAKISVRYDDEQGKSNQIEAQGLTATVIQHQLDYFEGKSFLDHLSPLKRNLLLKKMTQEKKHLLKPHVHGPSCHHD